MSSSDDPAVSDQSSATLVFELAALVLPQRHLPRPLGIAGNIAAHDPTVADKLPPADLTVVRVGVEGVKGPGSSLGCAHIVVIQRNVDLRSVLADIMSRGGRLFSGNDNILWLTFAVHSLQH